jgi:hypothetical protein
MAQQTTLDGNPADTASHTQLGAERVSIRAVLQIGKTADTTTLLNAGIHDPVTLHVLLGQDVAVAEGLFGDAMLGNPPAVFEPDASDTDDGLDLDWPDHPLPA